MIIRIDYYVNLSADEIDRLCRAADIAGFSTSLPGDDGKRELIKLLLRDKGVSQIRRSQQEDLS